MGKSGKLLKSLVAGVFKSPSKEWHANDDKDHVKKRSKDRCFGSLGKSASRNREAISATAASPEAIEIKCVQVESEKLSEPLTGPVRESFGEGPLTENKVPAGRAGMSCGNGFTQPSQPVSKEEFTVSDHQRELAVLKIQAAFRCYLAQRAFRALRALVRLQALARGQEVRRQAAISLRCFNSLIGIQALARGRRVRNSELGQLVQKHLQQTKHSRKKSSDGWVNSTAAAQQSHGKAHGKHETVTKRQRALVCTYAEQLNRHSNKEGSSLQTDNKIDKSHWIWEWLERWTAATLKGGPTAVDLVKDCVPVLTSVEKAQIKTNGGKHSQNYRKERITTGEHVGSDSFVSQRGLISEKHEEAISFLKKEEELKAFPDLEKLGTLTLSEQMPAPQPPPRNPPPPPLFDRVVIVDIRESGLLDAKPSTIKMPDVTSLSQCVTEVIQPLSPSSESSFAAAKAINHLSGDENLWSPDNNSAMSCPVAESYSSSSSSIGAANGHSVIAFSSETFEVQLGSPPRDCKECFLSPSSFSPKDTCITYQLPLLDPSEEANTSSQEANCGSINEESSADGHVSRALDSKEIKEASQWGTEKRDSYDNNIGENSDDKVLVADTGDGTQEPDVIQEDDENTKLTCQDSFSQTNGICDTMLFSTDAKLTEVSSKSPNGLGSKHGQTECISSSLPSYMATTMSSKAKMRSHMSPKQKSDLTKQKVESPKPKSNSPKTKGDLSSQKPDSILKRRHSLSALDGKVSMVTQNQRPASHVRTNSRGNFPSVKDLSNENFSLPNGDSRRHGK